MRWHLALALGVVLLAVVAHVLGSWIGPRGQAGFGMICFLGTAAACSSNLRRINLHTIGWGIALQVGFALLVIKFEIAGRHPGRDALLWATEAITKFLDFTDFGAQFVFGDLANRDKLEKVFGKPSFVFAFSALPAIIFVSSVFSLFHYLGVIQRLVAVIATVMRFVMRTSGAETLAAVENVFMGQSEAPLIVRPYVPEMTQSELLALMVGGMATLSGGMIAVYIRMGVDPVAILATGIMSAPCSLYVAKLLLPETLIPQTSADAQPVLKTDHANALDAIATGASTGMKLAINIAAMLIAFLAFIAMLDYLLGLIVQGLSLQKIFSFLFSPIAVLIGAGPNGVAPVADLLGTKLVANEFVAYVQMTKEYPAELIGQRPFILATYALAGFANFSSIGIQLGAMSAMAPTRQGDFAVLCWRALLGGFLATLLNASIAGMLLPTGEDDEQVPARRIVVVGTRVVVGAERAGLRYCSDENSEIVGEIRPIWQTDALTFSEWGLKLYD